MTTILLTVAGVIAAVVLAASIVDLGFGLLATLVSDLRGTMRRLRHDENRSGQPDRQTLMLIGRTNGGRKAERQLRTPRSAASARSRGVAHRLQSRRRRKYIARQHQWLNQSVSGISH
jgi:hypothetical protein